METFLLQGIVVEDNAANLEAVLDPQDDQEVTETETAEPDNTEEDVGEGEPPHEEEEGVEAGDGEEAAAEADNAAEEESPDGGDDGGDGGE